MTTTSHRSILILTLGVFGMVPDQHLAGDNARVARQQALGKQRRIIFNDDTYELSRVDANTPAGFLRRRLQPLVGTPVDTISFSVLGGWGDAPIYDSRIQPIFGDAHGGPPQQWSPYTARNIKALIHSGRDPLQIVIDFAHDNDMELFASMRMNDCHDSFLPPLVTLWKKNHPELLVDRRGIPHDREAHPLGLYVIAQDFSHAEVRQRKFEIIEEVCQRYDVDGVDLNFIRAPVFFSSTMRGEMVNDEEIEIMTNLLRRIRRFTDRHALKRGRPILLAAIVPDNPQLARNVGLDVKAWMENDLIDIVIPGLGYAPYTLPVEEWTNLAQPYGVKVYPCINRKAPQGIGDQDVAKGFCGVASNWYQAGADGVFFWNLGTPLEHMSGEKLIAKRNFFYTALPHLGSAESLIGQNKIFGTDDPVLSYYQHIASTPPLPVEIKPERVQQIPLEVGDDLGAEEKSGRLESLKLVLRFASQINADSFVTRLNNHELKAGQVDDADRRQISFQLSSGLVQQGHNRVEVLLQRNDSQKSAILSSVRLWVLYGDRP